MAEMKRVTVYVEKPLHAMLRSRNINVSRVVNAALRAILEVDTTLTDLKNKQEEQATGLATLTAEIRRREDIQLEALTVKKIKKETDKIKARKIRQWCKIRDRKIEQEGTVPGPLRTHWAKEIGCKIKDLDKMVRGK